MNGIFRRHNRLASYQPRTNSGLGKSSTTVYPSTRDHTDWCSNIVLWDVTQNCGSNVTLCVRRTRCNTAPGLEDHQSSPVTPRASSSSLGQDFCIFHAILLMPLSLPLSLSLCVSRSAKTYVRRWTWLSFGGSLRLSLGFVLFRVLNDSGHDDPVAEHLIDVSKERYEFERSGAGNG